MPRRSDIHRILVIGSGPIVIGQGAEFDYSGTQAAKALKEEGYEVILVNSNPATIMTDPEVADRTYIEPVTPEYVELIIEREQPDALLPTMGGQTALNVAMALAEAGVLEKHGVELIGAKQRAIAIAEDRKQFAEAMARIGLAVANGGIATTLDEALAIVERTAFPAIIRPSYTLGGTGGGIAYNRAEFEDIVRRGLDESPTTQVLVERSVIGWKEFELEVMRDHADNVVIVCSIENLDPMGVHTGRLDHGCAGDDAHRPRVSGDARRGRGDHSRSRGRGRGMQHPVRGESGRRRNARHRDESARVAVVGARLQGDRIPDRAHRGEAGRGLPAGRDPERHHQDDAGLVRAGARLRRGEDPALRLREVPRGQSRTSPRR